jgi:hypothetical protein
MLLFFSNLFLDIHTIFASTAIVQTCPSLQLDNMAFGSGGWAPRETPKGTFRHIVPFDPFKMDVDEPQPKTIEHWALQPQHEEGPARKSQLYDGLLS